MDATRTFPVTSEYNRLEAAYEGRHRRFPPYAYYWYFSPNYSAYATCGDVASTSPDTDPWGLSWKWFKQPIGQYIKLRTPDGRTLTTGYTSDKGKPIVPTGDPFVYCLMKDQPFVWTVGAEMHNGARTGWLNCAHTLRRLGWTVSHVPEVTKPLGTRRDTIFDHLNEVVRELTKFDNNPTLHTLKERTLRVLSLDLTYQTQTPSDLPSEVTHALALVAKERQRQMEQEGWTTDHDDEHVSGELAKAASAYIIPYGFGKAAHLWPWEPVAFKPAEDHHNKAHRIRELVKGAALACAEIDRLLRMEGNTL